MPAEQWEDVVVDPPDGSNHDTETDVAAVQALRLISEVAEIPAANLTDVAVKIGIAARDLRLHVGEHLLALLLESAERDCLRLAAGGWPANA